MASDARSVAEELRNQGKHQPAKLAEQAADRAESLGNYLQNANGDRILRDVEDFGRRQPWAVIAGGLALGFAASRFLKASSSRRYEQSYNAPRTGQTYTAPSTQQSLTAGAPTSRTGLAADDVAPPPRPFEGARPGAIVTDPATAAGDIPPTPPVGR